MKPFIIRRIVDGNGDIVEETRPQAVRRVVRQQTASLVTEFLTGVVEEGTGKAARIPWLSIAGKTGTSRKYADGRYVPGNYTASFVGFFPADKPRVVCLVMLDNPQAGGYSGGEASAPIFRGIVEKVAGRYVSFPAVRPTVVAAGSGGAPADGKTMVAYRRPRQNAVPLPPAGSSTDIAVPDLRGLSIRRALATLRLHGLEVSVEGSGLVEEQTPTPGQRVRRGTRVSVRCEPRDYSDAGR